MCFFELYSCSSEGAKYFQPFSVVSSFQMYSNHQSQEFSSSKKPFCIVLVFLGKGRFVFCIFSQLFPVKCVLIVTCRFLIRFPVTHFKFPGDNVPASPAKETAWLYHPPQYCCIIRRSL